MGFTKKIFGSKKGWLGTLAGIPLFGAGDVIGGTAASLIGGKLVGSLTKDKSSSVSSGDDDLTSIGGTSQSSESSDANKVDDKSDPVGGTNEFGGSSGDTIAGSMSKAKKSTLAGQSGFGLTSSLGA